jgi:hypothetical protein
MDRQRDLSEDVRPGDTVSIENTRERALSITIRAIDGTRLDMALQPGQLIEFAAGDSEAHIVLHDEDAEGLLVIQPNLPS